MDLDYMLEKPKWQQEKRKKMQRVAWDFCPCSRLHMHILHYLPLVSFNKTAQFILGTAI